ncbi:hypothetical protein C6P45_004093 [Maudiozyma exigua]|uniref:Uncharacterized protein n=1 Tax=Maudiozyma exigua TaxID=34358 RepID=A0A9P7BDS8_MAUEX|nr:hypothetical protein C6P45_004093 [Kazachstania exigua]
MPRSRTRNRHPKGSRPRYPQSNDTPSSSDLYSRMTLNSTGQDSFRRNVTSNTRDSTAEKIRDLLPEYDDAIYNLLRKGYTFGDLVELFDLDKYILRDTFEKRELNIVVQRSNRTLNKPDSKDHTYNLRNTGALGEIPGFGRNESHDSDFQSSSIEPDHILPEKPGADQIPEKNEHLLGMTYTSPEVTDNGNKKTSMVFPSKPAGMQQLVAPTAPTAPAVVLAHSKERNEKDIQATDTQQVPVQEINTEQYSNSGSVIRNEALRDRPKANIAKKDSTQGENKSKTTSDNKVTLDNQSLGNNVTIKESQVQDIAQTTKIVSPTMTAVENVVDTPSAVVASKIVDETPSTAVSKSIESFNDERMAVSEKEMENIFPINGIITEPSAIAPEVPGNNIKDTPTATSNELHTDQSTVPVLENRTNEESEIQTDVRSHERAATKSVTENVEAVHAIENKVVDNERMTIPSILSSMVLKSEPFERLSEINRRKKGYNGLDEKYEDIAEEQDQPMYNDEYYDSDTPLSCMQVYKEGKSVDDQYMKVSDTSKTTETNDIDENLGTDQISNEENAPASNRISSPILMESTSGDHLTEPIGTENVDTKRNDVHYGDGSVKSRTKQHPDTAAAREIEEMLQRSYPFNLSSIDVKAEGEPAFENREPDEDVTFEVSTHDKVVRETEIDNDHNRKQVESAKSAFLGHVSNFGRRQTSDLKLLKKMWKKQPNPRLLFREKADFRKILFEIRSLAKDIQQFGNTMEYDYSHGLKETKIAKQPKSKPIVRDVNRTDGTPKMTTKEKAALTKGSIKVNLNGIPIASTSEHNVQNGIKQQTTRNRSRKSLVGNSKLKQKGYIAPKNKTNSSVFGITPLYATQQTKLIPKPTEVDNNKIPTYNGSIIPRNMPNKQQAWSTNPFNNNPEEFNMFRSQNNDTHNTITYNNTAMGRMIDSDCNTTLPIAKKGSQTKSKVPNQTIREMPLENKNVIPNVKNTHDSSATNSFTITADDNKPTHKQNLTLSSGDEIRPNEMFTKKLNKFINETHHDIDQYNKNGNVLSVTAHPSLPKNPDYSPIIALDQGQNSNYFNAQTVSTNVDGVSVKKMSRRLLKQQRAARLNNAQLQGHQMGEVHGEIGRPSQRLEGEPAPQQLEIENGRQGSSLNRITNQPGENEDKNPVYPPNFDRNLSQIQGNVNTNTRPGQQTPHEITRTDIGQIHAPTRQIARKNVRTSSFSSEQTPRTDAKPSRFSSEQISKTYWRPSRFSPELTELKNATPDELSYQPTGKLAETLNHNMNRNENQQAGQQVRRTISNLDLEPNIDIRRLQTLDNSRHPNNNTGQSMFLPGVRSANRNMAHLPQITRGYRPQPSGPSSRYSNSLEDISLTGESEGQSQMKRLSQVTTENAQPKRNFNGISNPLMDQPLKPVTKRRNLSKTDQNRGEWDSKDESRIVDNSFIQLSKSKPSSFKPYHSMLPH